MIATIKAHMVADWRTLLSFASVKVHLAAIAVGAVYQTMPVLDPQVAAALPAPLVAKAISLYAVGGIILRAVKFKQPSA